MMPKLTEQNTLDHACHKVWHPFPFPSEDLVLQATSCTPPPPNAIADGYEGIKLEAPQPSWYGKDFHDSDLLQLLLTKACRYCRCWKHFSLDPVGEDEKVLQYQQVVKRKSLYCNRVANGLWQQFMLYYARTGCCCIELGSIQHNRSALCNLLQQDLSTKYDLLNAWSPQPPQNSFSSQDVKGLKQDLHFSVLNSMKKDT